MEVSKINEKISEQYTELCKVNSQFPFLFKPMSFEKFNGLIKNMEPLWEQMVTLKQDAGGIYMRFFFNNGEVADAINNKYSDYEWEILAPAIRNDDSIKAHLSDTDVLKYLIDIKQGIPIY